MRSSKIEKRYYPDLDLLRVIFCFIILFYHLNILKGGYLAVCSFFVLSGYLNCISLFKRNKVSLKEYYKNKFIHIYIPLLIFVSLTILITSFIPFNWIYMKPETTSVLLGYNNYWQINANVDYFTRLVNSPFTHLWFMAILLQFELLFPIFFIIIKKIWEKTNRYFTIVFSFLLAITSFGYFIYCFKTKGIMIAYYDTFSRLFALLFGVALGFIHTYTSKLVFKNNIMKKIIILFYLAILLFTNIYIDSSSNYVVIGMLVNTLVTMRLIDYSTIRFTRFNDINFKDKFIKFYANISYEMYLYQYLVIFIVQLFNLRMRYTVILVLLFTILISYFIHIGTKLNKNSDIFRKFIFILLLALISTGLFRYILSTDHTQEMKNLEEQLNKNDIVMKQKQEEYLKQMELEKNEWFNTLESLQNDENSLKEYVSNIPITGIGDSVMLGALDNLYDTFKHGYFDAKISRTDYEAPRILSELSDNNSLGDIIIIHLGTNGLCPMYCKDRMMDIIGDRKVFWINVTNDEDVNVNDFLNEVANKYSNMEIIDWNSLSRGHSEYFYADGIHLTYEGRIAYTNIIYNKIYKIYLDQFNERKNKILQEHDELLKKKYSFYGNDLLLNNFDNIHSIFEDASFNVNDYAYEELKEQIMNDIKNNIINKNVVIALDNSLKLTDEQYKELKELLFNNNVYIIKMKEKSINVDNITILDFYSEIKDSNDFIMVDKIHLTDKGNELLKNFLEINLK